MQMSVISNDMFTALLRGTKLYYLRKAFIKQAHIDFSFSMLFLNNTICTIFFIAISWVWRPSTRCQECLLDVKIYMQNLLDFFQSSHHNHLYCLHKAIQDHQLLGFIFNHPVVSVAVIPTIQMFDCHLWAGIIIFFCVYDIILSGNHVHPLRISTSLHLLINLLLPWKLSMLLSILHI